MAPSISRRRLLVLTLVCLGVLLVAGGLGAWTAISKRIASAAVVTWEPQCPDVMTTYTSQDPTSDQSPEPALASTRGWRCSIDVAVINSGSHSVTLRGIESPIMGNGGGGEVRAIGAEGSRVVDFDTQINQDSTDGVDARWPIRGALAAGETRHFNLVVGWRQSGCDSAGALILDSWPKVAITSLARTYRIGGSDRLIIRTFDDPHDPKACSD